MPVPTTPAPIPESAPPVAALDAGFHVPSTHCPYGFAFPAPFPFPFPFPAPFQFPFPCFPWTHFPAVWSQYEFELYQVFQLPWEYLPFFPLLCPFPQLPPPCPVEESNCIMSCIGFMALELFHAIVQ